MYLHVFLHEEFIETIFTFIKIETAYTLSKQTSWKGVDLLNISMNSLLKVIGIECSDFLPALCQF